MIGAGPAGFSAVQALRQNGYDDRVVLVGREESLPYERPALSKELLRDETTLDDILLRPADWFEDNDVELRLGCSASIDPRSRAVICGSESVPARSILIATGGRPRHALGPPTERVLYLRDLKDAEAIRSRLKTCEHLIVVGAGFIGAEVAASARMSGIDVTMLEALDLPMTRALGPEVGRIYADIHLDEGVKLRLSEGVVSIDENPEGVVVHTTKGEALAADLVVVGVGLEPATETAEEAGISVDNGILVDECCRTNISNVLAAGDVANHKHPLYGMHVRVEHFSNALKQGAAVAMTMVGVPQPYDEPHWFWSDQYSYNLQSAGISAGWDATVVRGSLQERNFVAFYLKRGCVISAVGINRPRDIRRSLKLISSRARVDHDSLRDESVDLRKLVTPA